MPNDSLGHLCIICATNEEGSAAALSETPMVASALVFENLCFRKKCKNTKKELAKPPAKRAAEVAAMPPPLAVLPPRRRPSAASLVGLDFSANAPSTSTPGGDSPQTARSDSSSSTASTSNSASTTGSSAAHVGASSEVASSSGGDFEDQLRSIRIDNERRLQESSERSQSVAAGEGEVEEDQEALMARAVIEAKSWKSVSENGLTIDRY